MKKFIVVFLTVLVSSLFFWWYINTYVYKPKASEADWNIRRPQVHSQPVIQWGNSSYHDSMGARDPWSVKENGLFYLFYDCMESLFNPSFESNLGTNGWDTYKANISSLAVPWAHSGERVLTIQTDGTINAHAGTGKYYYQNQEGNESYLAAPSGIEVMPNTEYIVSAYMAADPGVVMELRVVEYTADPADFANTTKVNGQHVYHGAQVVGRGNEGWQRVHVKFRTNTATRAIKIALLDPEGRVKGSFWDSVQIELANGRETPSDFPTDRMYVENNFNRVIEDTLSWRNCVASSQDGYSFTKLGMVTVTGAKGAWENVEVPGWMGTSNMSNNVFKHTDGKWYSYYWKGGQPHAGDNFYGRLRIGFPGGGGPYTPSDGRYQDRSGLAVADSITGPYQRISQAGSPVQPHNDGSCDQYDRSQTNNINSTSWGCDYYSTSGAPHFINGQWVIFVSGKTYKLKGPYNHFDGYMITGSYSTAPSPLGPWTPTSMGMMVNQEDIIRPDGNGSGPIEQPIYYHDQASGKHVVFYNQLGGGRQGGGSVSVLWKDPNEDPLSRWNTDKHIQVVAPIPGREGAFGAPWAAHSYINFATVVEDGNKLVMFYGVRPKLLEEQGGAEFGEESRSFLFHSIGRATFDLPLFPALVTPTQPPTSTPIPPTSTPIPPTPTPTSGVVVCQRTKGDADCNGEINVADFAYWRGVFVSDGYDQTSDFNGDGSVDIVDFAIWRENLE
jgi:hypothetical protein